MSAHTRRRTMFLILAGAVALAAGAGAWGYAAHRKAAAIPKPQEDPALAWARLRELSQRKDVSDEERRKAFENTRHAWESRMQHQVDEYFTARTEVEKKAVLDRAIDEGQKRRKEMEERRKQADEPRRTDRPPPDQRRSWANQTPQERKSRSESRSADETARRMAYFSAMRQRMQERGIEPPRWGPGGGGRPGRG